MATWRDDTSGAPGRGAAKGNAMAEYACADLWKRVLEALEEYVGVDQEAKELHPSVITERLGTETPPGLFYTGKEIQEMSRKAEKVEAARRAFLEASREYIDCMQRRG